MTFFENSGTSENSLIISSTSFLIDSYLNTFDISILSFSSFSNNFYTISLITYGILASSGLGGLVHALRRSLSKGCDPCEHNSCRIMPMAQESIFVDGCCKSSY